MSSEEIVEVVYGKYHKFEIVKKSDVFGTKFYLRKYGSSYKGSYSRLDAAVNAAKNEV